MSFTEAYSWRTPYVQQFNFGIQRELAPNLLIDVAYVGNKGTKLPALRNINAPTVIRNPNGSQSVGPRPYPGFGDIIGSPASAFPAFARKYGLNCTACHEAWPELNDFGRAFRDNGYQFLQGSDNPTTTTPGYIPVSLRLTPQYSFATTRQQTDDGRKTLKSGSVSSIGLDMLVGGTLSENVSFLVVPTGFTSDEGVTLESAWVRFSNLGGSSWANLKLGKHDVDLPRSSHRRWDLSDAGYLIYSYHSPGSMSLYDLGENQRGIEWVGHNRGSSTRAAVSVFNVERSPGSRGAFDTPGYYGHVTHEWHFESYGLSALRVGAFGSHTTWPTTSLAQNGQPISGQGGNLQSSSKFGFDGHLWFGPMENPLHLIFVAVHGRDDKALIPDAVRDGTFNGGFLEFAYTPLLSTTIFGRYDLIHNSTQGVADHPQNFNDEDAQTIGLRHTFNFTNRAEYAVHAEFSTIRTKLAATDGSDLRNNRAILGIDFVF